MPRLTSVLYKVGKTINLAKPGTYQVPRKPPLNTLIFEKLPEPRCGDKITFGIKGPPVTKPVRVCTKEDMQAFYCPPIPCDCKIKPPPLTTAQKFGYLFKQAMKACFVGGLICFTYQQGLWSDAFRSSCFLGKIVEKCPKEEDEDDFNEFEDVRNIEIETPEPCAPFIPRTGFILYKLGYVWNQIVIYLFWFILDGPADTWAAVVNFFKPTPPPVRPVPCRE